MKHHIIVKFKKDFPYEDALPDIKSIFEQMYSIEGIHKIEYFQNITKKDNRSDLMIVINMEKSSLEAYNASMPHQLWKKKYSDYIETKAIFDCE